MRAFWWIRLVPPALTHVSFLKRLDGRPQPYSPFPLPFFTPLYAININPDKLQFLGRCSLFLIIQAEDTFCFKTHYTVKILPKKNTRCYRLERNIFLNILTKNYLKMKCFITHLSREQSEWLWNSKGEVYNYSWYWLSTEHRNRIDFDIVLKNNLEPKSLL